MSLRRAALVLAVVLLAVAAAAQEATAPRGDDVGLGSDAEAIEGLALVETGRLTKARELAERMLLRRPDSYEGHCLLGRALHEGDANLPLAYHHLVRARQLFEKQHGVQPSPQAPWRWHLIILLELASVTREMDRFEETLTLLDAHDKSYDPDDVASRGWPLMRLRRYDEAREIVRRSLASKDPRQQQIARTTLCAIEAELQRRRPAYDACLVALRSEPTGQAGPHLYTNAASSALSILKPDEAERLMLEGGKHFETGNAANPWQDLTLLYIDQGRTGEALGTIRKMIQWGRDQPSIMDDQTQAGTDFTAALFLLVAGRGDEAVRLTDRILSRPDRTGFTSAESAQAEAASALLSRSALRLAAERRREDASSARGWAAMKAWAEAQRLRFQAWRSGREAARRLGSERMLVSTLRPYLPGGVSIPSWMNGDLVELLGGGVVASAVEAARRAEELPGAMPYLDAIAAEAALDRGQPDEALGFAQRALEGLGRTEVMLQARVAAVGGAAQAARGDREGAARYFARALQHDPGVIRRLGLALPVSVQAAGDALSRAVAEQLQDSPRLDVGRGGLVVEVQAAGGGAQACLRGPAGENLGCGGVARAKPGQDAGTLVDDVCRAFHEQVFAARVDLTQSDLRSLDGSTTVGRDRSEKKLDEVFGDLGLPRPAASAHP